MTTVSTNRRTGRALRMAALAVLGVVGLAAAATALWRLTEPGRSVAAAVPLRPDLGDLPREFERRVARCEFRARFGLAGTSALGELGGLYQANGFYDQAARCYRALLKADPGNPRWPHLLAGILTGYGEMDAAFPLLRQVTALAPGYVPARIRLADALLKSNQHEAARVAYAAALTLDSTNPYALMGLARCDLNDGNWKAARGHLDAVVASHPEFSLAWTLMAAIDGHYGNSDAEADDEARVKGGVNYRDCPDPWSDELMGDCYNAYQLRTAAATASTAGDSAGAIPLLDRALALSPDDAPTHRQYGNLLRQLKRYPEARSHLEQCVALDPDTSDNWIDLINLLREMGDGGAAERALIDGLGHCPDSPNLHYERGKQLKAAGHFEEALADFRLALRVQPSEPNNYMEAASVYFHLGRMDEGVDELKAGLMVDPVNPGLLTSLAFYSIRFGSEAEAVAGIVRARAERKVPRDSLKALDAQFRERFGHDPR